MGAPQGLLQRALRPMGSRPGRLWAVRPSLFGAACHDLPRTTNTKCHHCYLWLYPYCPYIGCYLFATHITRNHARSCPTTGDSYGKGRDPPSGRPVQAATAGLEPNVVETGHLWAACPDLPPETERLWATCPGYCWVEHPRSSRGRVPGPAA